MRMPGNLQLPKALTERRYRRNRFLRFYREPVRIVRALPGPAVRSPAARIDGCLRNAQAAGAGLPLCVTFGIPYFTALQSVTSPVKIWRTCSRLRLSTVLSLFTTTAMPSMQIVVTSRPVSYTHLTLPTKQVV